MKTRFSKKMLSAFLAMVMVVTSIPMFAITANAATTIEETQVVKFDFRDSSIYSSTAAAANPVLTSADGQYSISTGANTNNETGGFAQYDAAGLSISKGFAAMGIAKQTLGDNFRITLRTTVGNPMDNHDRAIISLGKDGGWNNVLDWTCGEIHVLSPGTVGGTAGDGTYVFTNPYQNTGLSTFVIEMLEGTLTLTYNGTTLYTQAGCAIRGSEIDYIRIFDDDSWWGGTGIIESLQLSSLNRVEVNEQYYKRYIDANLKPENSQAGYSVDASADGAYNRNSLYGTIGSTDRDIMSNVLYTAGVKNHWANETKKDDVRFGLQFGPITFLYDGENEMATPINMFQKKDGGGLGSRRLRYIGVFAPFEFRKMWQGGESGATYKTNSKNRMGYTYDQNQASISSNTQLYYSNTLYYTGGAPSGNYQKFTVEAEACTTKNGSKYTINSINSDDTKSGYVYVLNYKPIHDIYKNDRAKFDAVVEKECRYTTSALNAYYTALYNVLMFDLGKANDFSTEAGVSAAGNKIQSLVSAYNTAYANLENNLNTNIGADTTHTLVDTVTEPTCTADGYTDRVCSVCQFETRVDPVPATGHEVNYVYTPATMTTHTVSCSKGDMTAFTEDCADADHDGSCDKCAQSLLAVWDEYNNERGLLLGKLKDDAFAAAALEALEAEISKLAYFNYTDEQKAVEPGSSQRDINTEAAKLRELREALTEYSLDISAAEAAAGGLANAVEDVDRYDTSALDEYKNNKDAFYKKQVTVAGTSYSAFLFESQDALNTAVKSIIESLNDPSNIRSYTVYIDGEPCVDASGKAVKVPYGTPVTVDGDGKINVNVEDTNANYDGSPVAWRYSYAAPSNNNTPSQPKYMITSPSFGFVVKGDTYLTTSRASASSNSFIVTVIAKQNGNKVIDKVATAGTYTMPNDPSYVGYKFASYSNGAAPGQEITVTANTTIYAEYVVDKSNTYAIDFYDSKESFCDTEVPTPTEAVDVAYNQLVSFEVPDAYCWAKIQYDMDADFFNVNIISYGSKYSFYACESIADREDSCYGLVALTNDALISILTDPDLIDLYDVMDANGNAITFTGNAADGYNVQHNANVTALDELVNVYNNNGDITKYAMVGHYILPEGYTMVECGFIYATDTSVTDLKLDKVDNAKTYRFKSSRYTVGNQFVINLVNDGVKTTFNYAPYAIVKNGSTTKTVYGTVHENVTIN